MNIIIVGCGKVGETLLATLCRENHNIFAIDKDQNVIDSIIDKYDAMAFCGNGATTDALMEAGVETADLLIAVTGFDELNIFACLLAKKLGVKSTIARVRNPEYAGELTLMREELGLSMAINPELTVAREISQLIRFPAVVEVNTFAKGKVEIFQIVIKSGSPLDGLKIKDLYPKSKLRVLICAIERDGKSIIPNGEFVINAGDKINIVVPKDEEVKFFKFADVMHGRIDNAMIVGGGKIGFYLAKVLTDNGIDVKLFDKNHERCEEISEQLPKVVVIHGKGDEHQLLIDEGLESVGAFVTLTEADEENILYSMFAESKSKCKLITKINHHAMASLCRNMQIGTIITPKLITAEHILRYVRAMQNSQGSEMETLYKLTDDVEALEFKINDKASFLGVPLRDIKLKKNILVACISRTSGIIIPSGSDTIEAGDNVIVVTTNSGINCFDDIFAD